MIRFAFSILLVTGVPSLAQAGAPSAPVAAATPELRPFQADRPDQTEGPFTVVPGHLQLEMDLINLSVKRSAGQRSTAWNAAPVLLKYGLLGDLDVEAGFGGWTWERDEDRATGATQRAHGSGDTLLRLKWNLWGNDSKSTTAFALLPYVSLPSAMYGMGAGHTETGIDLPLDWAFADHWDLGLMTAAQWRWDDAASHLDPVWVNSASLSRELTDNVSMFMELYTEAGGGPLLINANTGMVFQFPGDWQFDAGCYFGVTGQTDDVHPFIGIAHRF